MWTALLSSSDSPASDAGAPAGTAATSPDSPLPTVSPQFRYPPWNTKIEIGVHVAVPVIILCILLGGCAIPSWWILTAPAVGVVVVFCISPLVLLILMEDTHRFGRNIQPESKPHNPAVAIIKRFVLLLVVVGTALATPFLFYVNMMMVCWNEDDEFPSGHCPSDGQMQAGEALIFTVLGLLGAWGVYVVYELVRLTGRLPCVSMLSDLRTAAATPPLQITYHALAAALLLAAVLCTACGGLRLWFASYGGAFTFVAGVAIVVAEALRAVPVLSARRLTIGAGQLLPGVACETRPCAFRTN
eukprot:TRINITY_DN5663_c0_g1_i4.p2 TRINITY_DN5663_c0_g1~~TRINITY_DN5663_c0_g1_i4.p2  ORF type:complete len:301 (+),score=59.97 TRINITY_DN5663_c0_g1_i4:173-1075(+)